MILCIVVSNGSQRTSRNFVQYIKIIRYEGGDKNVDEDAAIQPNSKPFKFQKYILLLTRLCL